jgi:hypothetical protein
MRKVNKSGSKCYSESFAVAVERTAQSTKPANEIYRCEDCEQLGVALADAREGTNDNVSRRLSSKDQRRNGMDQEAGQGDGGGLIPRSWSRCRNIAGDELEEWRE